MHSNFEGVASAPLQTAPAIKITPSPAGRDKENNPVYLVSPRARNKLMLVCWAGNIATVITLTKWENAAKRLEQYRQRRLRLQRQPPGVTASLHISSVQQQMNGMAFITLNFTLEL